MFSGYIIKKNLQQLMMSNIFDDCNMSVMGIGQFAK